jgi:acyl-coenzyme A thioesterase PaaI-like protein
MDHATHATRTDTTGTPEPEPVATDPLTLVRSDHACFGCGQENPIGLRLRFAVDSEGVRAEFTPAPEHQGFQDIVHGGIIATVLDEAMAWATAAAGLWTMTGEMQTRFRHPLHVGEPARVSAAIVAQRGRTVSVTAELSRQSDDIQIASAKGTFVEVSADVAAAWQARYLRTTDADQFRSTTRP